MVQNLYRISNVKLSTDDFCSDPNNNNNANCIDFATEPNNQSQSKSIENTVLLLVCLLLLLVIICFIGKKVCGWIKVNTM